MADALSNFKDKSSGLWVKIKEGEPQTLRVLTLDPLASRDQWGNTKYSFIVWNWTQNKAQILSKGPGVLKQLQAIHLDEDFDSLNKVDIKLSATGEGLETRYGVQVLPKARGLTSDMAKEAQGIKLEDNLEGGIRLSQINNGAELPDPEGGEGSGYQKAKAVAAALKGEDNVTDFDPEQPVTIDDLGGTPADDINLDDIPY